ncbi:hypothetical protein M1N44_02080, partial [Dehalococcoidia bacterium]|nr:hypothetical protein [Dehalococcoidia bacterium]
MVISNLSQVWLSDITLALQALKMAIARRRPGPGVIHHSDQGVQYASGEYVEQLRDTSSWHKEVQPIRV